MKIAIITTTVASQENKRLKEEAQKRGHSVKIMHPADLVFSNIHNKFKIAWHGKNILNYDIYRIGSIAPCFEESISAYAYLYDNGKTLVDGPISKKLYTNTKLSHFIDLHKNNLPSPNTIYVKNLKSADLNKFKSPFLIKDIYGSHGEGIYKIKSREHVSITAKKRRLDRFFVQEFINGTDHRIIVVGKKVIGVIKKIPKKGDFKSNISRGGKAFPVKDKVKITELGNLAITAAQNCGLEIAGVDIMEDKKGKKFVLEVNRLPQFAGEIFEKPTGANVAKEIIIYLEKIYKQKYEEI